MTRAILALVALAPLLAAPPARAGSTPVKRGLDVDAVTEAIVEIRFALPESWEITEIEWESVPIGWSGDPKCVLVRVEDTSVSFPHPDGFTYRPFYRVWILPSCWEGRMKVTEIEATAPYALYLGENEQFRVLYRTLGRNTWPEGREAIATALRLHSYPLSHSPRHSLDVGAMQRLFQRLDAMGLGLERWQQQIYGIEELPCIIYLELLTWEDRTGKDAADPTFLGDLAEKETRFLTRHVLAAFPKKRGLYLRRVTRTTFSDVLVVNPACLAPAH